MISVFEIYDGNPWKHAVLSRTQGDMSGAHPYAAGSTGPNLYMGFGVPDTVPVAAGEVWYLNVRMELWSIINVSAPNLPVDPSVAQGQSCNFGVKLYPAS